jgi:hypothetical protein
VTSRKGLLLRVGIDMTDGKYNAPINPVTNDYLYMPIPQGDKKFKPDLLTSYDDFEPDFKNWCSKNETDISFPEDLKHKSTHLDPDFDYSTYGDQPTGRGLRIGDLVEDDFIVFFASFKPITKCDHKLIYALYGLMTVSKVEKVSRVPTSEHHKNAHTRLMVNNERDDRNNHLVVFAKPSHSGRFDHAIPIGEYRNKSYRVMENVLDAWGGIGVKDGFIQRSVCPPWFNKPEQFRNWLDGQQVKLINSNWK